MADPVVEELNEAAAPLNERDAVNEDVRAAIATLKGEETPTEPSETETPPAAAKTEDRPRAADGKFAPKDVAPAKAAAPAPQSPPAEEPTKVSAGPSTASGAPPVSWAADAKQAWTALSPAIQTAVLKREQEVSAGFRQYSEKTSAYERALAPVAQEAQRFGLSTEDGIKRLLDGQRFLETQPAQAILWLAQKHGLNLAELATNPPAPQTPVRSEAIPPQFVQHVSSLEERINGILMDQNMSAVQQFAEKNAHYATVEDQLPGLMRELTAANPALRGVPLLQAAYDRAIWLNPDVRTAMIAEQQTQATQTAATRVQEKSRASTRAAVSVKGSSGDSRPPPKPAMNGAHVTDDVRAAIEQLRAG